MDRDLLARRALDTIPKMLTLLDRNPHSPTYGCFDRNFWQYKIIDFPSGMAQEFVWPLALVLTLPIPGNPYRGSPVIREWTEAGLRFAARSSHPDGSCDDYFPYERAAGASAFSLLACLEAYTLLDLDDPSLVSFFQRRAGWLAEHQETGRLSNHEALIVRSLLRLDEATGDARWKETATRRLERLMGWRDHEGWFSEYGGCDPGYLTLTISLLADIDGYLPGAPGLRQALDEAIDVAAEFMHPDGTFGGEYGSRGTLNFFPHGFERAGRWKPSALATNDLFLRALAAAKEPCYGDDHILGHHAWNYLLAWRDFVQDRPASVETRRSRVFYNNAGLLVDRRAETELYMGLSKGGVFKIFRDQALCRSDTHMSLIVRRGDRRQNAVAHMFGDYESRVTDDEIVVAGPFHWAKQTQMTPWRLIALRVLMLFFGRFFPNLVRRALQRLLITDPRPAPFRFERALTWRDGHWHVRDTVTADTWRDVERIGIGGHQTSTHTVMARVYAANDLQAPWRDLTGTLSELRDGEPLVVQHVVR